jgi:hypothetical protein
MDGLLAWISQLTSLFNISVLKWKGVSEINADADRGGVAVTQTISLPAPVIELPIPTSSKWEREHQAFLRLLPQLLATHQGQYVAIHEEKVVDSGDDKLALALRVLAKVGNVAIHVGRVTQEAEPVSRSGVRRERRPCGDLP